MPSLSEVSLSLTVPEALAEQLRTIASRDCSSLAGVARRFIAQGVRREIAADDQSARAERTAAHA